MITTIIFDFGDVFINLDKQGAMQYALDLFQVEELDEEMIDVNLKIEQGHISPEVFLNFYLDKYPYLDKKSVLYAWNYIIKDFPKYRLDWLKQLRKENKYKLILLSNTNSLHIDFIKTNISFYEEFKSCFDKFYLSHKIGLRKPNADIYEFVLKENNLRPEECFFIDDTQVNTEAASALGINIWNIDETKEDIVNLFEVNKAYFCKH